MSLAYLEAGDVEPIRQQHLEESELQAGKEGEKQKCGDCVFNITVKSHQGHHLLPAERCGEERDVGQHVSMPVACPLPSFTSREFETVEKEQRNNYLQSPHRIRR